MNKVQKSAMTKKVKRCIVQGCAKKMCKGKKCNQWKLHHSMKGNKSAIIYKWMIIKSN